MDYAHISLSRHVSAKRPSGRVVRRFPVTFLPKKERVSDSDDEGDKGDTLRNSAPAAGNKGYFQGTHLKKGLESQKSANIYLQEYRLALLGGKWVGRNWLVLKMYHTEVTLYDDSAGVTSERQHSRTPATCVDLAKRVKYRANL